MRIKSPPKTIMFNQQKRELCKVCNYPQGFCKHTIEEDYKDCCIETPLSKQDVWQLVRTYAICATEKRNMWNNTSKEIEEQKNRIWDLERENNELRIFKKQMEEMIYKTIKGDGKK
jgi:hypothetical protein